MVVGRVRGASGVGEEGGGVGERGKETVCLRERVSLMFEAATAFYLPFAPFRDSSQPELAEVK